jgi:hypothetical protein
MSNDNPYAPDTTPVVSRPVENVELSAESSASDNTSVPKGTVSEVKEWVGDDLGRAQAALDAENEGAQRVTLIDFLEDKLKEDNADSSTE